MYKVSVPMVRFADNIEENIVQAKRLGAQRIFMCPCRATSSKEEIEKSLNDIRKSLPIYKEAGFEVGVWIATMGHGGSLIGVPDGNSDDYTHITGLRGVTTEDSFCPLDPKFSQAVCTFLKEIAKTGVSLIMLDDDYRFSHRGDCGCTCKYHLAEYQKRLGESISREEIFGKVFSGGYNRYRQIYYDMLGDTLRNFAAQMRAAIDEVNPEIRFSFCAVTSSWDCDGTDAIELAKIMAGKTKPFLRFIGAPYWASGGGNRVAYVAELERMQAKWCEDKDIEIFSEGDTYPRPRFKTPAAYLEAFDTILRADGGFDGILKYGMDYNSSPYYETGYADRAERNRELYSEIERRFSDKNSVGINVTCEMKKMLHTEFTDPDEQIDSTFDSAYYQMEQRLLTSCSMPITYDDAPVTIAFGENGKYIRNSGKGFIIDAVAAKHLNDSGIDTGVDVVLGEKFSVSSEYFPAENETVSCEPCDRAVKLVPKSGAVVLSMFSNDMPSCVKYENSSGQRFLIYGFDFYSVKGDLAFQRNYMRAEQLIKVYEWLAGEKLPAVCQKNPDLYIMAKKNGKSMAVGLWNLFPDEIFTPVIELDRAYSRAEFVCCNGKLAGDKIYLDSDIAPYKFAAIEVFE
ncbi:MAG: hypothetical protein MJ168_11880 [Clostridia bacterium]|nr:hypothetical protein [Clostridia bacterium]